MLTGIARGLSVRSKVLSDMILKKSFYIFLSQRAHNISSSDFFWCKKVGKKR